MAPAVTAEKAMVLDHLAPQNLFAVRFRRFRDFRDKPGLAHAGLPGYGDKAARVAVSFR